MDQPITDQPVGRFSAAWNAATAVLDGFEASEWWGDGSGLIGNGTAIVYGGEDVIHRHDDTGTPAWVIVLMRWPGQDETMLRPVMGSIPRTGTGLVEDIKAGMTELRIVANDMAKARQIPAVIDMLKTAERADQKLDHSVFAALHGWSTPLFGAALQEFHRITEERGTDYTSSIDDAMRTIPKRYRLKACGIADDGTAYAEVGGPIRPNGKTYCDRRVTAKTIPLAICKTGLEMRMMDGSGFYL